MAKVQKIIDIPLADVAPPAILGRLTSDTFARLVNTARTLKAEWKRLCDDPAGNDAYRLQAFDAYKVAQLHLEEYKDVTASLLPPCSVPEAEFNIPKGAHRLGEAEPGTVEWLEMRRPTLGGSDVGAICKVGEYGQMDYDGVRASKTQPALHDQEHSGAALRGDLWEPWVITLAGKVLGIEVLGNKGTYTDGARHINLDGFVSDRHGRVARVVEAKTSSLPEEWETSVPDGYVLQTQHYGDFLGAGEPALIAANLNDERLVVWEVPLGCTVPAGPDSPRKLGDEFSYADVRGYAEDMVAKWTSDGASALPRPRRGFEDTEEVRHSWREALSRGIVLADLETTGYCPDRGHIIEVALVRIDGSREVERFHRFYGVPEAHAEWNGTGPEDIHRISLEDVEGLPVLIESPEEVQAIREFIGDSVLVAHNASFEDRWLSFNGVSVPCADTMKAFGIAVQDAEVPNNTMASLVQWAGFEYKDAHRAINDVLMMLQVMPALEARIEAWLADQTVAM